MRILRWLSVLPVAVIAALLASFPVHWSTLLLFHQNSFLGRFLSAEGVERFGYAVFVPAAFVLAGAAVAPRLPTRTAVVLSAVVAAALAAGFGVALTSANVALTDPPGLLALKLLASAASLTLAVLNVRKRELQVDG